MATWLQWVRDGGKARRNSLQCWHLCWWLKSRLWNPLWQSGCTWQIKLKIQDSNPFSHQLNLEYGLPLSSKKHYYSFTWWYNQTLGPSELWLSDWVQQSSWTTTLCCCPPNFATIFVRLPNRNYACFRYRKDMCGKRVHLIQQTNQSSGLFCFWWSSCYLLRGRSRCYS